MMKERPILFSAPMVRALLDGTKTQTLRAIKPEWWRCLDPEDEDDRATALERCPYGAPGDRLWVREAFAPYRMRGTGVPSGIADADYACLKDGTQVWRSPPAVFPCLSEYAPGAFDGVRWRPSIHMPRWASRTTLEIVGVRVEQLHDISERDAIADRVERANDGIGWRSYDTQGDVLGAYMSARGAFFSLWRAIHGAASVSASANPWVWALTFRRVQP